MGGGGGRGERQGAGMEDPVEQNETTLYVIEKVSVLEMF
jgi:hypothetical protein